MESWKRFNETSLPNKVFYSELYLEDISDEDYMHSQKVFEELKLKNLGEHHHLHVQSNRLFLAGVLKTLETSVL